jgi:hypothetical protein
MINLATSNIFNFWLLDFLFTQASSTVSCDG